MADGTLLRALNGLSAADAAPDAELLRRFAASRDEIAFELLVRRHADLVWKVCRGILAGDLQTAEDAFQATFLALTRRPEAVGRRGSVGGWLFQVARHAALRARRRSIRLATVPLPDDASARGSPPDESAEAGELAVVLAEEIDRLSARFRDPVLLCYYQGYSHAEAAARLGWPVGTVASRIARARDRLREQLARRGIALSSVGLLAVLGAEPVSALSQLLVRDCVLVVVGRIAASESVLSLTTGVLIAMRNSKRVLTAAVAALMVAIVGVGTVGAIGEERAAAPQPVRFPEADAQPDAAAPVADDRPVAGPKERALSQRNLRLVAQAIQMYHLDHGHLPTDIVGKDGKPLLSWRVAILPYMEQRALHKQFKLDEPWDSEHNRTLARVLVKVYSAHVKRPSVDGNGMTLLKRLTGPSTLHLPGQKLDLSKIPDGRMMTLLVVEVGDPIPWTKPEDPVLEPADPMKDPFTPRILPPWKGPFANVVNAVFADGVALSLKPGLARQQLLALAYASDGMVTECRSDMIAAPPVAQDREDAQSMLRLAREMADQLVKLSEEEARLRAELAKANREPPDTATPLADLLLELDQQLRELRSRIATLKHQLEQPKK